MGRYELTFYDVWGNASEGFWVNDQYVVDNDIEITEDVDDDSILDLIVELGYLKTKEGVWLDWWESGHAEIFTEVDGAEYPVGLLISY